MWNTFVSEFTAENGAGLEFRLLVITWIIMIIGLITHSVYKKMKGNKIKQLHIIKHQYRKVS